ADIDCPFPDGKDVVLRPNPYYCEDYFACSNGEAIPMKCPKGLHFNSELRVCDWPWHAGC
ncbi:hypothetical protein EAI_13521, partial [Harpegnathos saltator]